MITFLIPIAKLLVAILPFLSRKSKLKGKWRARYLPYGGGEELVELVELNQLSSMVWGAIKPIDNEMDPPKWLCYGINRDQVFVGVYFSKERLKHWQGSFTLSFKDDYNILQGYYSGFEETEQQIVTSEYRWDKLPSQQ